MQNGPPLQIGKAGRFVWTKREGLARFDPEAERAGLAILG